MGWIVVRHWRRFQHYGDRRQPPWIKLYLALLHDDDFQELAPGDRAALMQLWILYAMTGQSVRDDTAKITRAIGQRFTKKTLERLTDAGFITVSASKPASTRLEVDVDVDPSLTPPTGKPVENDAALLAHTLERRAAEKVASADEPERDPDGLRKIRELAAKVLPEAI